MNNPVIALLKIELHQDGSYMVAGCLQNKVLALELLEAAKEQVLKYNSTTIIMPR